MSIFYLTMPDIYGEYSASLTFFGVYSKKFLTAQKDMSPEPEKVARRAIDQIMGQVSRAQEPKREGLKAKLKEAEGREDWDGALTPLRDLKAMKETDEMVASTAAAFLTALRAYTGLDIPDTFSVSEDAKESSKHIGIRKGGIVSRWGTKSGPKIVGAVLTLGGRSDEDVAREVLGSDSPEAVRKVEQVMTYTRTKMRAILSGEELTVKELVDRGVKQGKIDSEREDYVELVKTYGHWDTKKFIDEVLIAKSGPKKKKDKGVEQVVSNEVELDTVCERVLASAFLAEGALTSVGELVGDDLETLAIRARVIGPKEQLLPQLQQARDKFSQGKGKITSRECEEVKRRTKIVVEGRQPGKVSTEGQINSFLLIEISRKVSIDPLKSDKLLKILFPRLAYTVTADTLVEDCRRA